MDAPLGTGLPAPGDRIADKYDVVRVVGEGGMGVVYEVMHTRLQQRAAIKMLQPRVQAMPDVASRFEREARAACRLRSRHAVRITDVDQDAAGRAYIVMEFLEGRDLAVELAMRGRLPVAEAVTLVLQACVAMAEAHTSGVVHRDLKPSNLFLVPEGGERIVKVLDFGISKLTTDGEAAVTSTFATMGTPLYMSPEQIRSAKNVDGRTDIWSLGVILFEAIAGVRPFQGSMTAAAAAIVADDPPLLATLAPEVPPALDAAVRKALSKKAEDRFADVRSFAEALLPFGTNPDLLRAMDAGRTGGGTSLRPLIAHPGSSPSFVQAATMAQTTPPPVPNSALSPLARTHAAGPPVLPPSTEAGWATQGPAPGRAGRAARVVLGIGLAAVAAIAVLWMKASHHDPAPSPTSSATQKALATSSPSTALSAPLSPPVSPATVVPEESPVPRASPGSAIPAASASAPSRVHAAPKLHASSPHPVSSAAPATSPSAASPSANPLHL
jgi:serine/threonine-protein kinase